jgi:peroxiredoxin Q/BCP
MYSKKAPDFSLLDQDGKLCNLSDYKGRWLVVYFYPSDKSLNCTREACYFRDEQKIIAQFGNAGIVGINKGTVASHKKFVDRNHLNFPILSDSTHEVTKAYGAWRSTGVKWHDRPFATRRNTYLIDPDGMIVKEYIGIIPRGHVETIIQDLQQFQIKKPGRK